MENVFVYRVTRLLLPLLPVRALEFDYVHWSGAALAAHYADDV